jgi:hypothetical protein
VTRTDERHATSRKEITLRLVKCICVLALAMIALPSEGAANVGSPGKGPYGVGSTFLLEHDSTRTDPEWIGA